MKLDIKRSLLLAPLAEITHAAFRHLLVDYGSPDLYFTEMLSAAGLVAESPFTSWYLDFSPEPEKTVVQLVGGRADDFRRAAEKAAASAELFGFDINMGCSVPKIRKRGWGVALMENPERALEIAAALRSAFPRHSVSAKLRLGEREEEERLLELARGLEGAGLDFITLHPKTSRTVRSRPAKWSFIALLRRELRIPVVGNGGVTGPESLRRCRISAGDGGVMVGRGAVRQPWIFSRLRTAEAESGGGGNGHDGAGECTNGATNEIDLESVGIRHLDLMSKHLPPEFRLSRARRFFFYFCDNLQFGYRLKMHMQEAPDTAEIARMWSGYFRRNPHERVVRDGS
jgi:tRNA-dihydrouridine synthase